MSSRYLNLLNKEINFFKSLIDLSKQLWNSTIWDLYYCQTSPHRFLYNASTFVLSWPFPLMFSKYIYIFLFFGELI